MGVTPFYKMFKHDGAWGPNMAAVYSDRGHGVRAPIVFYNRSNEAAAQLKPGDFDWAVDLRRRRALVSQRRHLRVAVGNDVRADHRRRCRRRTSTAPWSRSISTIARSCGAPPAARNARRRCSDGSSSTSMCWLEMKRTCRRGLALPVQRSRAASALDSTAFISMIDRVVAKFPQLKIVATTLREVQSTSRHSWSAVAWMNGDAFVAPTCDIDVYDRVGGGDGFASGLFYGLLTGESPEESVRLGWAHGALIATFPGDTTMATVDQVRAFAKGGSARIQR